MREASIAIRKFDFKVLIYTYLQSILLVKVYFGANDMGTTGLKLILTDKKKESLIYSLII